MRGPNPHLKICRLNKVLSNVFAERLLLSLRKVDDPGTRVVISSLAFNIAPNDNEGSADAELSEGTSGNEERNGSAEMFDSGGVEVMQRNTSHSKA